MSMDLYQELILEHNKSPKNFGRLDQPTHQAEGFNPLCGDHYHLYLVVDKDNVIDAISFFGQGCAISKASASMLTSAVKTKTVEQAKDLFSEFKLLLAGQIDKEKEQKLGKLKVFSGIWQYPSRVKCANLAWHTLAAALSGGVQVSTENSEKKDI